MDTNNVVKFERKAKTGPDKVETIRTKLDRINAMMSKLKEIACMGNEQERKRIISEINAEYGTEGN